MAEHIREIRAVYDGKVFVPKEEVDLVEGQEVEIDVRTSDAMERPRKGTIEAIRKLAGIANCPTYDPMKFSREDIYP